MSVRQLLRKPLHVSTIPKPTTSPHLFLPRRLQSTASSSTPTADKSRTRIDRVLNRVPKFLSPWTNGLRNAPGSNVVAFLILHELTAVVPLVGLTAVFHWAGWLPTYWTEARYITDGTEKFGRYFARKGWFGFSKGELGSSNPAITIDPNEDKKVEEAEQKWHVSKASSKILVEVATAYAITKVFLPARILLSVWATPWFARVVVGRGVGRYIGKSKGGLKKGMEGPAVGKAVSNSSHG